MSYFVHGSSMSYSDYLQAKSFSGDITGATRHAAKQISMEVSNQTKEVIASNEALAREHIQAQEISTDRIIGVLNGGFDRLSYKLEEISGGISELNATFHWGFGEVIASLGHMNDTLSELVKIAKTPVQTVAFNHFEIARDAFRQGLYEECVEELEKAISGDQSSAGYKLEWRFHQMMGTVRLGFAGSDIALIDLPKAEESFLLAARYGKTDYPEDAGRAFLAAGWVAYCQGKMAEALAHTEQAIAFCPQMGEAFFQAAKVKIALGQVDVALPVLRKAIDLDRFYALKAAGDGDFQRYDDRLREFLEALRQEKYRQSVFQVKALLDKIRFWREHSPEAKLHDGIRYAEELLEKGGNWPLLDMLAAVQVVVKAIEDIEAGAKDTKIVLITMVAGLSHSWEESYQVEESYAEKVVVKPGGFFRKAVTEMLTKTRTVMQTRTVQQTLNGGLFTVHDCLGTRVSSVEFCAIPPGSFFVGDDRKHKVTISNDFLMGKYPVTQNLWQAVLGDNPSNFKGQDRPVENVSWDDCQQFIEKFKLIIGLSGLRLRLPTEAEWEYACRAGSSTEYCFGDDESSVGDYAWYNKNSEKETHPVGQKKPNAWGLHDMHGNVWEWCQDRYGDYPAGSVTGPSGSSFASERVIRGGSWYFDSRSVRSSCRNKQQVGYSGNNLGFRLVLIPNQ